MLAHKKAVAKLPASPPSSPSKGVSELNEESDTKPTAPSPSTPPPSTQPGGLAAVLEDDDEEADTNPVKLTKTPPEAKDDDEAVKKRKADDVLPDPSKRSRQESESSTGMLEMLISNAADRQLTIKKLATKINNISRATQDLVVDFNTKTQMLMVDLAAIATQLAEF